MAGTPASPSSSAPVWALRSDGALAAILFVLGAALSWHLAHAIDPALYRPFSDNFWFQSDIQRIVSNMLDAGISHYRTNVHPLYSILVRPPVWLLSKVWPGTDLETVHRFQAGVAGLWAASLYLLWRLLSFPRLTAIAFVLFGLCCSSFLYWVAVPETYGLGSISLILVLIVAAWSAARHLSDRALVATSAASLSITVTNWMAGLALAIVKRPPKEAVRVSVRVLVIVAALALVQKAFFPTAGLFFLGSPGDIGYINHRDGGTVWNKLTALLAHSIVMPQQLSLPSSGTPYWSAASIQHATPGTGSVYAWPALTAWIALFVAGMWGAVRSFRTSPDFLKVLGLVLAGQLGLHVLYGDETFLYTLHLLPLLLTVAIFSTRSPLKSGGLLLALVAAGLTLANNIKAFEHTQALALANLTQREQVLRAMRERPDEIWPRGVGHVVLGAPGSSLQDKAYHEPGAAFSPAPGSFGLSIWLTDAAGKPLVTSDTVPMDQVHQQLVPATGPASIELRTSTPAYTATWRQTELGWTLRLRARPEGQRRAWIVARSVGPAGAPLTHAAWRDGRLQLNDSWQVVPSRTIGDGRVGLESQGGVALGAPVAAHEARDTQGWLYAAVEVPLDTDIDVDLRRVDAQPRPALPAPAAWMTPRTGNPAFDASLHAQQAHLLMGLTDNETRPGEPVNYDFEWSRDGAFSIVALVRTGHADAASVLLKRYAEQDFFGGFGAEADAPGLALWAMDEVAAARPAADMRRSLWPHVQRKAEFIARCLSTDRTIEAAPEGRVLQKTKGDRDAARPCEAARQGLIMGRMDNQYPVPYVNAVSYMGLKIAARWAAGQGDAARAERYAELARNLGLSWKRFYLQPRREKMIEAAKRIPAGIPAILKDQRAGSKQQLGLFKGWAMSAEDARTYIVGLWPSWVAAQDDELKSRYSQALDRRWQASRDDGGGFRAMPNSTYFDVAEAHQWLLAGRPERAWATLDWFLQRSRSPGLYTWWEGFAEENSSHLWESIRGWVQPDGISPHYWTAAEIALLQLDMLAYVDESAAARPIVIGAGVPQAWLAQELRSGTIQTARGPVSWTWKEGTLQVNAPADVPLRPAAVFAQARLLRQ